MKFFNIFIFVFFFVQIFFVTTLNAQKRTEKTTIILVRHAEKADDGTNDPPLTKEGLVRAVTLAYTFRMDTIHAVFSTDYLRTLQTAEPIANYFELPVRRYLPQSPELFLERVLEEFRGKKVVIVGHSNTIPTLLNLLTNSLKYPFIKDYVYHDLFIAQVETLGKSEVLHLNYGEPSLKPKHYNQDEAGFAIDGYDVVAYQIENRAVKGTLTFSAFYDGGRYLFYSQKNLERFLQNPKQYLPQFGGWCAFSIGAKSATEQGKMPIIPSVFKIINSKLYLFSSKEALALWEKEEETYLNRANAFWKALLNE